MARSLWQQVWYSAWGPKNRALRFCIVCLCAEPGRNTRGLKTNPRARAFGCTLPSHVKNSRSVSAEVQQKALKTKIIRAGWSETEAAAEDTQAPRCGRAEGWFLPKEVRNSITHPCLELIKASWKTAVVLLKTVVVKQRHSAKSSSAKREKEAIPGVPQNSILKPFTVCFSGDPLISSNLFQISWLSQKWFSRIFSVEHFEVYARFISNPK